MCVCLPVCQRGTKGIFSALPKLSSFSVCILHSGLSVIFLSLVAVSQLCVLSGGSGGGGITYGGKRALEVGGVGHAGVLFLFLGDVARRDSGADGRVLCGWEGS